MQMRKILKRIFFFILGLAGLLLLIWLGARLFLDRSQIARAIVWMESDVEDYRRFPYCTLHHAGPVYDFKAAPEDSPYRSVFETITYSKNGKERTDAFEQFLKSSQTRALLVIKDGELLYEGYANGSSRASIQTSFSAAKSFDSILVGFAIADGSIASVDDPITNYLPELEQRDPRFSRITIRHLLTMTSGLRYVEAGFPWSDDAATYYAPDLRRLALEKTRVETAPGETFLYNNYNPLLIGLILERAAGQSVCDYIERKLWQPLGMEADGSWSLDSEKSGFAKMESGINARAIDFAKVGQLFLQGGVWNGEQILPREWVDESTRADIATDPSWFYQYFWWVHTAEKPEYHFDPTGGPYDYQTVAPLAEINYHFTAAGKFGQYIYVIPEQKLVFARFGTGDGGVYWRQIFESLADRVAEVDR